MEWRDSEPGGERPVLDALRLGMNTPGWAMLVQKSVTRLGDITGK